MKKAITMMVCAALVAGAVTTASAQEAEKPTGISIRAGVYIPTERGIKDFNDTWFAAGVDYQFSQKPWFVSVDYTAKDDFRIIPFTLNYKVEAASGLYGFLGAGFALSRRDVAGGGNEDKTRFAYQAGIGWEFQHSKNPLFLEGRFVGNDNSDLNSFAAFVGIRL